MFIRFSAVFKIGRWENIINTVLPDSLVELAKKLPEMCLNFKADTTRHTYKNSFNRWSKWCVSHKISSIPASELHVSLYLMHLSDLNKSSSSINEALYSISWAHRIAGVSNPCISDFVMTVKEGILRTIGQRTHKKEPITPEVLRNIVSLYVTKTLI